MIVGRTPFEEQSNTDTLAAILTKEPSALQHSSVAVPAELQRIVSKMLRKDKDERYQFAKDVLLDLQNLRRTLRAVPRPDSIEIFSGASVRTVTKEKEATSGLARGKFLFGALVLLLIAAISLVVWRVPNKKQQVSDKPRLQGIVQLTTWPGLDIHPSLSPDANAIAYSSDHSG